jgi:hypothetical protein
VIAPKANLRKFRGYSSDCQNQKYEAISEGFVADDAVSGEPVSGAEFPVIREKNKEFRGITRPGPKIGAYLKAISEC